MKKILKLFTQIMLISSFSLSVTACFNPLTGGNGNDGGNEKPDPPPIPKDIEYYQQLIEKTKIDVANCQEWIEQIKKDYNNGDISEETYKLLTDQVSAGLYIYQSEINEYQYQILLLEKKGDKFTHEQILQGIDITTEKITNLEKALKLEEKYPKDYPESKLAKIKANIKETVEIKEMFSKLKEEEENKCDNYFYHDYQY